MSIFHVLLYIDRLTVVKGHEYCEHLYLCPMWTFLWLNSELCLLKTKWHSLHLCSLILVFAFFVQAFDDEWTGFHWSSCWLLHCLCPCSVDHHFSASSAFCMDPFGYVNIDWVTCRHVDIISISIIYFRAMYMTVHHSHQPWPGHLKLLKLH